MRFQISQINPKIGDIHGNKQLVLHELQTAKKNGAALVLFPELTLVGYPPRDLLESAHLIDENLKALDAIASECRSIAAVVGFVERNPQAFGKPYYNSVALLHEGKRLAVYRKRLLPYYDVFEDERYFESGAETCVVTFGGLKIALTICEDVWNFPESGRRLYAVHPFREIAKQGPDVILNASASPFHLNKRLLRKKVFHEAAKVAGAPMLFCNQVGGNDDLIFDGCSFAIRPDGSYAKTLPAFEVASSLVSIDELRSPSMATEAWPVTSAEWLSQALALGIRDYCTKSGVENVCLGLSGGIDSSVVAVLAVKALGKGHVTGVALPSRFNAAMSLDDAKSLAKRLGIALKVIGIDPVLDATERALKQEFGHDLKTLTLENVQPRLRMTYLMAVANEDGALLLNTSNKSEIFAGYSTLYGDSAGALSVLGDLTKDQVHDLAKYFNKDAEVIPTRVIERPPTAELRAGQLDSEALPPYPELDLIVRATLEQGSVPKDGKLRSLYAKSEFKRQQFSPILRVSRRAFGRGRRIPLASTKPWELPD